MPRPAKKQQHQKRRLVAVEQRPVTSLTPSKINDAVYRPPSPDDPEIQELARSMRQHGVLQPLNVTQDGFILSGHRRFCAARLAGIDSVPVIVEPFASTHPDFLRLLVMHNQQRSKTVSEMLAEEVVRSSADEAHRALVQHRVERGRRAVAECAAMDDVEIRRRAEVSRAKWPMLQAVIAVVNDLREFWPLSLRTIHYNLLNAPPLRHASKPASRYRNDRASYKDLSKLLTRARVHGLVPYDAIDDATRPVETWNVYRNAGDYMRQQLKRFMANYWRDLLQSQPHHIEVVGEKNTLLPIIQPVCEDYTVPLTIGRGYCSLPPRKAIHDRWHDSGKDRLVLVVLSDHDPDGAMIVDSLVGYMQADFAIPPERILGVRAALTADQCRQFDIPTDVEAKATSSNYRRFVNQHGRGACELEAVPPRLLQRLLRETIESVLDLEAFKAEQSRERTDAADIDHARKRALAAIGPIDSGA